MGQQHALEETVRTLDDVVRQGKVRYNRALQLHVMAGGHRGDAAGPHGIGEIR